MYCSGGECRGIYCSAIENCVPPTVLAPGEGHNIAFLEIQTEKCYDCLLQVGNT